MIYLLKMRDTQYIKIGYTNRHDVAYRRDELQTGCPRHLDIVETSYGTEKDERRLHRLCRKYKTDGGDEWFDLDDVIYERVLIELTKITLERYQNRQPVFSKKTKTIKTMLEQIASLQDDDK